MEESHTSSPFDQGFSVGKSGGDFRENPFPAQSDNSVRWRNGWKCGRFEFARKSGAKQVGVECPQCEAVGTRVVLDDGTELWDPSGDVFPISGDPSDPELPDEDRYCETCHYPFREDDADAYEPVSDPPLDLAAAIARYDDQKSGDIGFVYVVRSEFIRIGKAKSESRYKSYQSSLPRGCEILKVWHFQHPLVAEQWLHNRYKKFRVRGSWYDLPPDKLVELLSTTDFPEPSILLQIHKSMT